MKTNRTNSNSKATHLNVSRETLQAAQLTQMETSARLFQMEKRIAAQTAQAEAQKAQTEAQTDAEEQNTFLGYADRYAQAAETVRDTHFLLSLDSIKHCTQLADSYRDRQRTAWTEATETARTLANIISASVCKKCDSVSASEMTRQLRASRAQDVRRMETAAARIAEQITASVNAEGDTDTEYSADYAKVAEKVFDTIMDGADLYQTAYETIMAEGADGIDFEYTERVLDRRVVIRTDESAAWKDTTVTAGQAAHRAVRALIENSRAAVDNNHYCYLAEIVTDTEGGTEAEAAEAALYHRLPKFFSEMDTTQDSGFNVHPLPLTVSDTDAEESVTLCEQSAASLAEQFDLSAQQKDILSKLFMGYGQKAIATFTGCTKENIKCQIKRTKEKVKTSDWYAKHTAATAQADGVLFLLETEAQDSKTAAQRATEATDIERKAAQAADAAQRNAHRAEIAVREVAYKGGDLKKAQKAAEAAQKAAEAAQAEAEQAQKAAEAAQRAADTEKAAQRQKAAEAAEQKAAQRAAEQAQAAQRAADIRTQAAQRAAQAEAAQKAAEQAQKAAEAEQAQKAAEQAQKAAEAAVQKAKQTGRAFYRHVAVLKITAARKAAKKAARLSR